MRKVICTLPENGTIEITAPGFARSIVGGDTIDLDRVIVPAVPESKDGPERPAVTYEDALGHHIAEAFAEIDPETGQAVRPVATESAQSEE